MRILKWLVGGVLVVALLLGGAFVWGMQRVPRARAARVEALGPLLARATAMESLSPEDACLVVECHYMKRSSVLTAECRRDTLEATRPGVVKFRGLVVADEWDDALLGGGYVPTLCLSKGTSARCRRRCLRRGKFPSSVRAGTCWRIETHRAREGPLAPAPCSVSAG